MVFMLKKKKDAVNRHMYKTYFIHLKPCHPFKIKRQI